MKSTLIWVSCLLIGIRVAAGQDDPASKYRIEKLLTDLNHSESSNKSAREGFIELGDEAVPRLLQEVAKHRQLPASVRSEEAARMLAESTRALRVLADMESPAAISVLSKTATAVYLTAGDLVSRQETNAERWKSAFRNEELDYLYGFFSQKRVRDIYVELATNVINRYKDGRYGVFRWRTCRLRYVDHVHIGVDILAGIPLMIRYDDRRVEDLLIQMLETMPYEICDGLGSTRGVASVLSPDGFNTARMDLSKSGVPFDYRIRMTCLQYVKQLGVKKAAPAIEPLLKSQFDDERRMALSVLLELTKETDDDTKKPEAKPDRVFLRDGKIVSGKIINRAFTIKTAYAQLPVNASDVSYMQIRHPVNEHDVIETRSGDRLTGELQDVEFVVQGADGAQVRVEKDEVESIAFGK